jgi:hypothetical protein
VDRAANVSPNSCRRVETNTCVSSLPSVTSPGRVVFRPDLFLSVSEDVLDEHSSRRGLRPEPGDL